MHTLRLVTVVGARPQFVKAATVSRAIARFNAAAGDDAVAETLIHTGQHYDRRLSDVFFEQLGTPPPAVNLGVGSARHGAQTAAMLSGLESELVVRRPDRVLVYGDTNSTLAGALAAVKLGIPVAHVEAGLRSYNRYVPEEINRVVADRLSELLFCPTPTAVANLEREGITEGVKRVGDVMFDSLLHHASLAKGCGRELDELGLRTREYYLATVHRAENTDHRERLAAILEALGRVAHPVVLPLHPRTEKALSEHHLSPPATVRIVPPQPYLEMIDLIRRSRVVLTDSGGLQKEAYWLGVPCVTLREETEWRELVEIGCNRTVGADVEAIVAAVAAFETAGAKLPEQAVRDLFGDGDAATAVVRALVDSS